MISAPFILGLDVSKSRTGAAYGPADAAPRFCSIVGRDLDNVRAMGRLGKWLIDFTKHHAIAAIYFEAQINVAAFMGEYDAERGKVRMTSSPEATVALAKMAGVVEFVADMRSIPAHPLAVNTIRSQFLGDARAPNPKERARAMCQILGWTPEDLDQADAAAVWYVGATREVPTLARIVTPMEQKKAATMTAAIDEQARAKKAARKERKQEHSATGPFAGVAQERIGAAEARGLFARERR